MEVKDLELDGAKLINVVRFEDKRGVFNKFFFKELKEVLGFDVVESYASISKKYVLRGLHFQKPPFSQAKLVYCSIGKILDVIVDMRNSSPTFGKWISVELSDQDNNVLFVPRGFAHGFVSLTDNSLVNYLADNEYNKQSEGGVIWNDSYLNIKWPVSNPIVSDKDKLLPSFKEAFKF